MSLLEIKKIFLNDASNIPNYNLLTPTELGNGYCDADESNRQGDRSHFWSALMLRYWYKIPKWQQSSRSLNLPDEDFVDWLSSSLEDAFYYRSWRWEYEAVVRDGKFVSWKLDENGNKIPNKHYWKIDPNAVDRTINFFCAAQRGKRYQFANKDKRKSNGASLSIDGMVDENGRQIDFIGHTSPLEVDGARELVSLFLKQNKNIEALIIDGVAYQDSFKQNKDAVKWEGNDSQGKTVTKRSMVASEQFDLRKLVKHLSTIDTNFIKDYFCSTYFLSEEKGQEIIDTVSEMSNPKWYKCIQKTFLEIKGDKKLLSCLMDV